VWERGLEPGLEAGLEEALLGRRASIWACKRRRERMRKDRKGAR
jgi:hypothetical protein